MLSFQRAFLIYLDELNDPYGRSLSGRVEHVASGRAVRFANLEELLAFVVQTSAPGGPDSGSNA